MHPRTIEESSPLNPPPPQVNIQLPQVVFSNANQNVQIYQQLTVASGAAQFQKRLCDHYPSKLITNLSVSLIFLNVILIIVNLVFTGDEHLFSYTNDSRINKVSISVPAINVIYSVLALISSTTKLII